MPNAPSPPAAAERLSRDADALLAAQADGLATARAPFDCDLLIVGSGYGGAVAAARLAGSTEQDGSTSRIWLVERGAEHLPGSFPSRIAELPGFVRFSTGAAPRGRRQGLLDLRAGGDVSVLLGNGLGGGSLINANVMLEPDAAVFRQGWPGGIDARSLQESYDAARQMLSPARLPAGRRLRKLEVLDHLGPGKAERCPVAVAWQDGRSAAGVQMHACTECGDCLTGCNQGAKGSLDTNYLAQARGRGVAMFCGVAVLRLEALGGAADGGQGWSVLWRHTEPRQGDSSMEIRARRVLLAAGALGSTEILLRSKPRLPLSDRLGQGFSMNGDAIAAGLGHDAPTGTVADPESDPAARRDPADPMRFSGRRIGPTIVGLKRIAGSAGRPGFAVEEFAVPAALRRVFGELVATLGLLRGVPMSGDDPALCSEAHIERMSLVGLMGDDGAGGELVLPAGEAAQEGSLQVRWPGVKTLPVFAAMNDWLAQVLKPGPLPPERPSGLRLLAALPEGLALALPLAWRALGKYLGDLGRAGPTPTLKERFLEAALGSPPARLLGSADLLPLVDPLIGLAVTVHPLGGCRMADSVAEGVVNRAGQVWRPGGGCYAGLAVLDGALMPRALGINPALTIAALAERAVPELMSAWTLTAAAAPPPLPPRARPAGPRRELPAAEAVWQLRERLQGPLHWDGHSFWARLDLEFEELPGFIRALQLPERVLQLRAGSLTLQPWLPGGAADEYFEPAEKTPAPRLSVRLSGSLRLFMPLPQDQEGGEEAPRVTLDYRLAVQGRWAEQDVPADLLRVGSRLLARKCFGLLPDQRYDEHPAWLRQLSEAQVQIDGQDVGRWMLDQGHLASMRSSLLDLTRHSTMPDALLDALVGGAYVVRRLLPQLVPALLDAMEPPQAPHLNERWPGRLEGLRPDIFALPAAGAGGARLSRYRSDHAAQGLPVLLVHGMGAAGNSYTHPCLNAESDSLLSSLHKAGREVWVLDVRSSIANETGRRDPLSAQWTVEQIACSDIPAALRHVLAESGAAQIDVFGHCMGAVMLWMALLDDPALGAQVHAAVFSQVGPWLRMSDCNRLRGFLIGGLLRYLPQEEADTCPDFFWDTLDGEGLPQWKRREPRPLMLTLQDALLAGYPYPDGDGEAARAQGMGSQHWRAVRHRGDTIFGQLFEQANLSDTVLEHLDALVGWVKLPMLAQAIHFARLGMITDVNGRNRWLAPENLRQCLSFPVLILHGRRNRVFDWQGSEDSLRQLKQLAYGEAMSDPVVAPGLTHYGPGSAAQLLVFENYGHFDCVIGRHAGSEVFPKVLGFLGDPPMLQQTVHRPPRPRATTPWIGPAMGWLRRRDDGQGQAWLGLRLMLQPKSREDRPQAVALVPVGWSGGMPVPQLAQAAFFPWPPGDDGAPRCLDLWHPIDGAGPAGSFAVLMLDQAPPAAAAAAGWRLGGARPDLGTALQQLDMSDGLFKTTLLTDAGALEDCQFHLGPQRLDAADRTQLAASMPPLQFALGSCHYPPTLLDEEPAQAGFALLLEAARRADGPQFLILAGDQIYLDADGGLFAQPKRAGGPQRGRDQRTLYESSWRLPARRRCLSRLPCYPMLDDHEIYNDWGGLAADEGPEVQEALRAYRAYQHGLAPGQLPRDEESFAYRFAPGGVPFFMLDGRSRRAPRSLATMDNAALIPDADMAALEQALLAAPRQLPKFVLSAAPLLPPSVDWLRPVAERIAADGWSGYPASAARLLRFIRDHDIRRVVLLAGDSHLSSVSRFVFDPGAGQGASNQVFSIVSSGLYTPWPFINERPDELWPDGPLDLGLPHTPCLGRYRLELMSTREGYAQISLLPPNEAQAEDRLRVSLRSPGGANVFCTLVLD